MITSLTGADVVRFDASDLMPGDVGAGTFWTEGTSAVNGEQDAQEAADKIEASWPS
jgi:alpha-glucoside transport system substrate-binding protein